MRKIIICFLISFVTLIFSSCVTNSSNHKQTPNEAAKELQTQIMECFVTKDKETLKSFFCEYLSSSSSLDSPIEKALNFIDGDIISYDEPFSSAVGNSEKKGYGAHTTNIITTKGTEYKIVFDGWFTNDEEPERIGVTRIKVINMTENDKLPSGSSKEERDKCCAYIGDQDA